ncbi:MAG: hypothetical protein JF607_01280 [Burkholderiales bacterium]|nr:hypothetical protein [Burkholderiales bacterium]
MDAPALPPDEVGPQLEGKAKAIGDLDSLVQALLTALPASKPWQRQLRMHLADVDRVSQVLRLVVAMGRSEQEVNQAAGELLAAMRAAKASVNGGRADMGTKAAASLGFNLAQKVVASLSK